MSTHKSIAKSAGVIGAATLLSRILGFLRDLVIARLFGVYTYAQAFVVAFRIPNLLRDLVGEGAANAAIVPVFSETLARRSKEEFWELAGVVLNLLLVVVTAITLAGIIFAPLLVRLMAPGFCADAYKLQATIRLTQVIFPYLLLISLAAYSMAVLNSLRHFAVPAFSSCLLNISIILFAILCGEGTAGLAAGVLVGGLLQLAVQVPVLYKKGFRLNNFLRQFRHPAAQTIGRLMLPRIFSSAVYQLNNLVDSIFGSLSFLVGEGGVAGLYFAYRLIQFPLGIFSASISQAILPAFSVQALEEGRRQLKETLYFGMRALFFVLVPASVAFMALSRSIIGGLFKGGMFDAYSAEITSQVLFFYSIGLFAYGGTKVLQSCFFGLKDTVTPARNSLLALILNIIFNAVLVFPMKLSGVALATSLSGIISFAVLLHSLKNKLAPFSLRPLVFSFLRIAAASACMGLVCLQFSRNFAAQGSFFERMAALTVYLAVGLASYALFCFIFRVREMKELWLWLAGKKQG